MYKPIPVGPRPKQFREYSDVMHVRQAQAKEVDQFGLDVLECVCDFDLCYGSKKVGDSALQAGSSYQPTAQSVMHLAAEKDDTKAAAGLQALVNEARMQVVNRLVTVMDHLQDAEIVGGYRVTGEGVCCGYAFRWTKKEEVTDTRTIRTATEIRTERDIMTSLFETLRYAELMKATSHPVEDKSVPRPARVQKLIDKTPAFLKPHLRIIAGDEIYRRQETRVIASSSRTDVTTERRSSEERNAYKWDPFLVLFGFYCIASW